MRCAGTEQGNSAFQAIIHYGDRNCKRSERSSASGYDVKRAEDAHLVTHLMTFFTRESMLASLPAADALLRSEARGRESRFTSEERSLFFSIVKLAIATPAP